MRRDHHPDSGPLSASGLPIHLNGLRPISLIRELIFSTVRASTFANINSLPMLLVTKELSPITYRLVLHKIPSIGSLDGLQQVLGISGALQQVDCFLPALELVL